MANGFAYEPSTLIGNAVILDLPGATGEAFTAPPVAGAEGACAGVDEIGRQNRETSGTGRPEITRVRASDGRGIRVVGEIVYELGPDGATLRRLSYRDFTKEALDGFCPTAADLRARWLREEQRGEIRGRLQDAGVDLRELAAALGLPELDPLDLLLHIAFGQRVLTRRERAEQARRAGAGFFGRYHPAAREVLEVVLEKYAAGEAPDVGDTDLLKVPPLSQRGTWMELAGRFGGGDEVRAALKELERLVYRA